MKKITPTDVAKALGKNPNEVRLAIRSGHLDIGIAYKKDGASNYTYVIFPEKVKEILGEDLIGGMQE